MADFNLWGITHAPGSIYEPCNGTEGDAFINHFCRNCIKDMNEDCELVIASMVFRACEPGYPKEWVYNENGNPTCTAFERIPF